MGQKSGGILSKTKRSKCDVVFSMFDGGQGVRFKKKKKTFFMLLGLWMFVVCSPVFFKNEPSILGSIDMIDSRRSAGCF